jgi:hypothetical protein
MAYIGNTSPSRFVSNRAASVYSGDGSTTAFTLEQAVAQDEDVLVSVDGVIQEPSVAYAVSNGTTLTFTAAPSSNSGNNIFVYYLASQVGTVGHPNTQALSATSGTFSAGVSGTTGTFSGAITGGGTFTPGGNIVIPDAGNIGSASDTDAMAISSGGVVTFSQKPVGTGMDFLQSVTASDDATVEIGSASLFTTTYRTYIIYYSNVHLAADNGDINLRFGIGGSIKSDSYYDFTRQVRYDGDTSETGQAGNNQNALLKAVGQSRGNATGEQSSGYVMIYDPASTDNYKHINIFNTGDDVNNDATQSILAGRYNNGQAALTAIQFYSGAGNITSGYFRLYGIV